jgi:YidC/Oxa1 family membrane protein insertase
LLFLSKDGKQINTRNLVFEATFPSGNKVLLKGDETFSVDLLLSVRDGKRIIKRLTFTGNTYSFDAEFLFENVNDVVSGFEYQVLWENPLPYAEQNSIDESSFAQAFAFSGGEVADINAPAENEPASKDINGATDWVAARNKYFAVAMIPAPSTSQGAVVEGHAKAQPDRGIKENYSLAVKMPFKGEARESARFTVFLGPLDYSLVKSMGNGLDHIMSLGAVWIIRPITEYVLMPLFNFLHLFISNWGIVIIVFSIIIKIALHPLTKRQMDSMRKMSKLAPMMNEIREKYPDDPQKVNGEMMKLYRDYGINPAGGCLPLLLQMPILYALYNVFASTIQLRQSSFVGWINDLSIPDSIVDLPFTLPLFGISQISGLALGMCITMFIQQKQAVTDPRQKAMIYMMPIMMMLIFNNLPSGLNLYYFVFNLLSIGAQWWTNKKHGDEPLRKVDPKKAQGGLIGRLAKNLPELQKMQQRR